MNAKKLSTLRARQILAAATKTRVLVVGDVMLDQFIWGGVSRISPEAPVPVVDFSRESFMPGGAANVARNLVSLATPTELFGAIGNDDGGRKLQKILAEQNIGCTGLVKNSSRHTSIKTRIVAHQQQVVRIDRETRDGLDQNTTARLLAEIKSKISKADAVIVGDYGKGVVTQPLLNEIKSLCRARGVWLSLDPKPVHHLNLSNLSLITPNRKEAFELADLPDDFEKPKSIGRQKTDVGRGTIAERTAPGIAAYHPRRTGNVTVSARSKTISHSHGGTGGLRCFRRRRYGDSHIHAGNCSGSVTDRSGNFVQSCGGNCRRETRHGHNHAGGIDQKF